jgi:hypothetical protein
MEGRDVATVDVEGAYLHALTKSPSAPSEERVEKPILNSILRKRSEADGQTLGVLQTTRGEMTNASGIEKTDKPAHAVKPTYAAVVQGTVKRVSFKGE